MKYLVFPSHRFAMLMAKRVLAISDKFENPNCDKVVESIHKKLDEWRQWLSDNNNPFLKDADTPERDVLSVVQTIGDIVQPDGILNFFDHWVHDSMAGLAFDKVNEFLINGVGLFKFRRVYWGDRGDAMLREKVATENALQVASSREKRQQRKQWDLEAAEFRRTRS